MIFYGGESRDPQQVPPVFNGHICQSSNPHVPTYKPQALRTARASASWLSEIIRVSRDLDNELLYPPGSWHSSAIPGMGLSRSSLTHTRLKPRTSLFQVNTLTRAISCSLAGPSWYGLTNPIEITTPPHLFIQRQDILLPAILFFAQWKSFLVTSFI